MAMTIGGVCGLLKPPLVAWHHATRNNTYLCTQSRRASQPYPNLRRRRQLQQSWRVTNSSINAHSKEEAARLIWRAVKLPIYSVALVPLTVGSATAYLQMRTFDAGRFCLFLFSSVLIIMWLNLSNDVYDFDTGADKDKKDRSGVLYMAYICLVIGCGGLLWGSMQAGDGRVFSLLASAILCGYVYQCPPCRLSYLGLGEPLCFAAFGPLATSAFYFSQSSKSQTGSLPFSITVLCVSILIGITTTLILFCSHFHQIDGDREVGKMSPLVRMGTERGSVVVKYGVVSLYLLLLAFVASKALPLPCLFFPSLTLPVGKLVIDFVQENHNDKETVFMAKYYCVRLHALFGAALALGLFSARTIRL
ncbi:2-carboxy-1,4-naphthoquinone phytyltransferase, chloroplastic isoform X2 [Cryptomeria japonica]|uniref:2-carboxy-1,4-naphthoquinone phytyltransferase, chloroplastic isoform X2 n=1 Tax=Cryptomeria japonica TaxID=3369 RepID=UPI0025AD0FF4|nr:2-carboxy-1,4-naphthoquinone phytyltransferase, chloroplastic isoform X2 [Cryptomeria japonica]